MFLVGVNDCKKLVAAKGGDKGQYDSYYIVKHTKLQSDPLISSVHDHAHRVHHIQRVAVQLDGEAVRQDTGVWQRGAAAQQQLEIQGQKRFVDAELEKDQDTSTTASNFQKKLESMI